MNNIIICDNKAILQIRGNKHDGDIIIDIGDIDRVKNHSWYIKDGNPTKYVAAKIDSKTVKLHRFIMKVSDRKQIIDHIDRNSFNNQKTNLRICTHAENNRNTSIRPSNKSGRMGVRKVEKQGTGGPAWLAEIRINGKRKLKVFTISKYGEENAYNLACKQRNDWEEENGYLNQKFK